MPRPNFVINIRPNFLTIYQGVFMPGVEIKGSFLVLHSVNVKLHAWSGNKGVKMVILGFILT